VPEARACLISDNYLKFAAVLLAPGIYLGGALGSLRIHGLNDGSAGQPLPYKLHADILMALEMHRRIPELAHFTHRLAAGTAASARSWGDGGTPVKELFDQYLQELPFFARLQMRGRSGSAHDQESYRRPNTQYPRSCGSTAKVSDACDKYCELIVVICWK
jgi:hypothetical protein